jgi:hypothetical protein
MLIAGGRGRCRHLPPPPACTRCSRPTCLDAPLRGASLSSESSESLPDPLLSPESLSEVLPESLSSPDPVEEACSSESSSSESPAQKRDACSAEITLFCPATRPPAPWPRLQPRQGCQLPACGRSGCDRRANCGGPATDHSAAARGVAGLESAAQRRGAGVTDAHSRKDGAWGGG